MAQGDRGRQPPLRLSDPDMGLSPSSIRCGLCPAVSESSPTPTPDTKKQASLVSVLSQTLMNAPYFCGPIAVLRPEPPLTRQGQQVGIRCENPQCKKGLCAFIDKASPVPPGERVTKPEGLLGLGLQCKGKEHPP